MKLKLLERQGASKRDARRLRREGQIPAVIYVQGKPSQTVAVPVSEFSALMRHVQPGRMPTTVFTLVDSHNKERKVVIKEIQYHPTTYNVIHLDFEELHANVPISIKVPVECTGIAECAGIKLGGSLRQVIRYLRVRCLPKHIPEAFVVDISGMGLDQSLRLSQLKIPQNVRPLLDLNEVAVVVSKR